VTPAPIAATSRRDVRSGTAVVESRHVGHVVVVGPDGRRSVLGDPDRTTFVRSAVKPFQATTCLELAGDAARDLTAEEVAVGWASHQAEPFHLAAVDALLARSGTPSSELTCPPAEGDDGACERRYHNCSGKHALFALAAATIGCPRAAVLDPDGPLQREVLAHLDAVVGPIRAVTVDGCGAPAVATPLAALAEGFRRLRTEDRYRRVVAAGAAAPRHVGGTSRLESALLAAGVTAKPGAEGVFAASWAEPDGVWAIAAKAEDGASRAVSTAVFAVLVERGVVDVGAWQPPEVWGGGRPVGVVAASDEVRRAAVVV
jgi:L-asparaginase II